MTKYANINILDDTRRFRYVIEYKDNAEFTGSDILSYREVENLRVDFFNDNYDRYIRNNNYWKADSEETTQMYIPRLFNVSSANIYFPTNSVESYTNNYLYMLTVNTWIHGHTVYLGTYLLDRRKTTACRKETKFLNSRYYEYINVKFIDPWYLTYSEDWKEFRQQICGETELDNLEQNNTGSILNFTLYPVVENGDEYIKLDPYIGGQNAINISDQVSDYISSNIHLSRSKMTLEKIIEANISFNRDYCADGLVQTFDDLKQYMEETYCIDPENMHVRYSLMVLDDNDVYKFVNKEIDSLRCEFTREELKFENWVGFKEGLRFILMVSLFIRDDSSDDVVIDRDYSGDVDHEDEEDDRLLTIRSNEISITQDVMKYFVGDNPINYVNLTSLDMNNYTINAVNKIEKKVIQIEKPNDSKSNMIKPVYFRTATLSNIIVHPAVTENICINLDAYKSQVETFFIQIEGVVFVETARVSAGVIFKIEGANLTNEQAEGVYYILNQDKEVVTSGKYRYES